MGVLWRKSGTVELDLNGARAPRAKAYFYVGGTDTTPIDVYQDAAATTPHPHPVVANGIGKWPAIFIPFTASYDERITTTGGTQLSFYPEIPNPDPVEASEDSVDDTALIQTGMVIWMPVAGTLPGFVRANERTIGNAASGATERANADTEDLFVFLWNSLANAQAAVLPSGRGASAGADYAANKTLSLPNLKSAFPLGLSDMGDTANGLLSAAVFLHGGATTPGSIVGANTHVLTIAQLPAHDHSFNATTTGGGNHSHTYSGTVTSNGDHAHTITITDPSHIHSPPTGALRNFNGVNNDVPYDSAGGAFLSFASNTASATTGITASSNTTGAHQHNYSGTTSTQTDHTHDVSGNTGSTGSGTAVSIVSRAVLGTFYVKL